MASKQTTYQKTQQYGGIVCIDMETSVVFCYVQEKRIEAQYYFQTQVSSAYVFTHFFKNYFQS